VDSLRSIVGNTGTSAESRGIVTSSCRTGPKQNVKNELIIESVGLTRDDVLYKLDPGNFEAIREVFNFTSEVYLVMGRMRIDA